MKSMIETSLASNTDEIRLRFEDVLRDNIRRLMDTMPEAASLPFDIVTITSLILLVERENEIQTFPESAEARYSEKTLIDDLAETGIDMDDNSKTSVGNLTSMGFITTNEDNELIPRESTPRLVAVLDNLFPGMPGMNLVAYFLQTLQEAVSGRKDIEQAISQIVQTLFNRGVFLSKLNKSTGSNGKPDISQKESNPFLQAAKKESELRGTNMQRLREMRSKQSGTPLQKFEVKSLFPPPGAVTENSVDSADPIKAPSEASIPEIEAETEPPVESPETTTLDSIPEVAPETQTAENSEVFHQSDGIGIETDHTETRPSDPSTDRESADSVAPALDTPDDADGFEAPGAFSEDETVSTASGPAENVTEKEKIEEIVDEKIQAFQEYLAMTCPYCREGKVLAAETEKGKTYYSCENPECNFISWGKPYHFSCPYCQNPFLVEFNTHDGINGLKCPKATCNFRQDHLESPLLRPPNPSAPSDSAMTASGNTDPPKKKRKKLVRKRLVRRKR